MKNADEHLTEETIVAIADGVPPAAMTGGGEAAARHLEACDACAARVADAALLSLAAHTALREERKRVAMAAHAVAPAGVKDRGAMITPAAARAPSARWPFVMGAALLLVAVMPTLVADAGNLASNGRFLRTCAAVLARGVTQMAHHEAGVSSSLGTWLLALVFALAGIAVARIASRSKNRPTKEALP